MDHDPKKLISESFKIDGITEVECRSIFFGWVLDYNSNFDINNAIKNLYEKYYPLDPEHPMNKVLLEGLSNNIRKKKRNRNFKKKK